ncbi:phage tail protein [Agromyces soli]|uniref:Tail fiber protein n=1 Tax=Agromyces soli TaxID=659012 RepID=A0ABY4AWQ9_9MICO|nr:tail fiber protein [Agromyces soli]UOE27289.1 tail fiber protein [Agromyces soli]
MADPYLGEIRRVAFNFAPKNWAFCNGQILSINTNQALFSLLGTTYGGNGSQTFALPNLQGRTPRGAGDVSGWGRVEGEEFHRLTVNEMPTHTHQVRASNGEASASSPAAAYWAATEQAAYGSGQPATQLRPAAISNAGQTAPHENRPPFLVVNYIIALSGIYPSRP